MFGAIILTFVITALAMTALFLVDGHRKLDACNVRLRKENDSLRKQIDGFEEKEHARRERSAYDRGMYDARGTDALYRQVLKKYNSRDHADVMMNGEATEEN